MNIDQIKTFLAVYRAGSFIDVAKEQIVAPSSVSRTIAALENNLKTRLFQRTTRNLSPTQAGEAYFQKIGPLIEEMELVHHSLIDATATPVGRLRLTASVSYGQIVIAPRLKAFREQYPKIELELHLSDGQVDLLGNQIDLAIRHGSLPDSSLVARKLADVKYRLVASHAYLEQYGIPQKPEDLQRHELITLDYSDYRSAWTFEAREASQTMPIQPTLTVSNAAAIRQSVRDGAGIALLADWTIDNDLETGRLIELLPGYKTSGASTKTAIWLVYPSNRFVPAKVKAFVDFVMS